VFFIFYFIIFICFRISFGLIDPMLDIDFVISFFFRLFIGLRSIGLVLRYSRWQV